MQQYSGFSESELVSRIENKNLGKNIELLKLLSIENKITENCSLSRNRFVEKFIKRKSKISKTIESSGYYIILY